MKIYERVESLYKCTECGMGPNKWILIARCFTPFSGIRMKTMMRPHIGVCVRNVLVFRILFQIKQWMNDMLQLRKDVMKDIRSLCVTKSWSFWVLMEFVDQSDSLILGFGTVECCICWHFGGTYSHISCFIIHLNLIQSPWKKSVILLNIGKLNN
jgi:hypothetical protein